MKNTHLEKNRQTALPHFNALTREPGVQPALSQPADLSAAIADPRAATPEALRAMQQQAGNQAVLDWLKRPTAGESLDAGFSGAVQAAHGTGQVLPGRLREELEHDLGADFGAVRLHVDEQADALNQQIEARAFTVGADIFFQHGAYSPHSAEGQRTLRHELTHVVQQGGRFTPHLRLGPENDAYEQEARRFAAPSQQAPAAGSAAPVAAPTGKVQRLFGFRRKRSSPIGPGIPLIPDTETYTDADLPTGKRPKPLGGGTANEVFKAKHPGRLGGFFKPQYHVMKGFEEPQPGHKYSAIEQMAQKSVFSSRIDKAIGTHVLSNENYASYGGLQGGESEEVPGRQMDEDKRLTSDEEIEAMRAGSDKDLRSYASRGNVIEKDGRKYLHTDTASNIDYTNPTTQRTLSDIQVNDAITGQKDRHNKNLKVDDTGAAHAYDNDWMGESEVHMTANLHKTGAKMNKGQKRARKEARLSAFDQVNNRFVDKESGLPQFMDVNTAQSLAGLKKKDMMAAVSAGGSLKDLDPKVQKEVAERYEVVRRYAKAGLGQAGLGKKKWASKDYQSNVRFAPKIVGAGGREWGDNTYAEQVMEGVQPGEDLGRKDQWRKYNSYLQRGVSSQLKKSKFDKRISKAVAERQRNIQTGVQMQAEAMNKAIQEETYW